MNIRKLILFSVLVVFLLFSVSAIQNIYVDSNYNNNSIFNINTIIMNITGNDNGVIEGEVTWNSNEHTLNLDSGLGPVNQVGYENWILVVNHEGQEIKDGQAVYVCGTQGNRPAVCLARADDVSTAMVIGVATMDIPNNQEGIIIWAGSINDIDTNIFTDNATFYLSATEKGNWTTTAPLAPNFPIQLGIITNSHAMQGSALIQIGPTDVTDGMVINSLTINENFAVSEESILTGNVTTQNWFRGLFNWTTLTNWLSFDGSTLSFNETKLNETIDLRSGIQNNTEGWNVNFTNTKVRNFWTYENNFRWQLHDDGANMHLDLPDLGGSNYFGIETTGAFFQLYANPNPSVDYLLATITETQGAITEINFYEGGTGHNRFWSSGSLRIGGDASRFCSNLTSDVDCNTPTTGADLVVQDDIWAGGKIFASDWSNVSGISIYNATYDAKVTDNETWNEALADTLYAQLAGGNSFTGQQDFNGGWTSGGASIIDGNIFAQTGYFYNLTSIGVDSFRINGSLYPQDGFDDTFEIGNSTRRWKSISIGTGDSSFAGNVGIGITSPGTELDLKGTDYPTIRVESTDTSGGQLILKSSTGEYNIYQEGEDLRFFSNAADRVTFKANGNVGIGDAVPKTKLEVRDGAQWSSSNYGDNILVTGSRNNAIGIESSAGNKPWAIANSGAGENLLFSAMPEIGDTSTGPIVVMTMERTTGDVGIGTTNPGAKLELVGTGSLLKIQGSESSILTIADSADNELGIILQARGAGQRADITRFDDRLQITVTTNTGNPPDTNGISILNNGDVGIGDTTPSRRLEVFDVNNIVATFRSSGTGGGISFQDATTGGDNFVSILAIGNTMQLQTVSGGNITFKPAGVETVRFVAGGNVGIGTTSPIELLQVGDSNVGDKFLSFQTNNNAERGILYYLQDGTTVRGFMKWDAEEDLLIKGDNIIFNAGQGADNAMFIQDLTGNVGIGTETPTYLLDVSGTFRTTGNSNISQGSTAGSSGQRTRISVGVADTSFNGGGGIGGIVNIASGGDGGNDGDGDAEGGEGGTINMVIGGTGSDNDASDGTVNIGGSISSDASFNLWGDFTHFGSYSIDGSIHDPNSALSIIDDLIVSGIVNISGTGINFFSGSLNISKSFYAGNNSGIGTLTPGKNFTNDGILDGLTFEISRTEKARLFIRSNNPLIIFFEEDGPVNKRAAFVRILDGIFGIGGENDINEPLPIAFSINLSSGNVGIGTILPTHKLSVVGDLNVTGDFIKPRQVIWCDGNQATEDTGTECCQVYAQTTCAETQNNGVTENCAYNWGGTNYNSRCD